MSDSRTSLHVLLKYFPFGRTVASHLLQIIPNTKLVLTTFPNVQFTLLSEGVMTC